MTTYAFHDHLTLGSDLEDIRQKLNIFEPFSYCLICKEKDRVWDFFYITEDGELSYHLIKCYKFGKLKVYKNAGEFLSKNLEGLMTHLIGRPLSSCSQVRL